MDIIFDAAHDDVWLMTQTDIEGSVLPIHGNDAVAQQALGHRNDDSAVLLALVDLAINIIIDDARPVWILPTRRFPP